MWKHIEIGGTSYSGSTTLNLILGSLPGVIAIGESHWLVDMHEKLRLKHQLQKKTIFESSDEEYDKAFYQCRLCNNNCTHYTREFRQKLKSGSHTTWHKELAQQFKSDIIVTSDKHPDIIRRLDNSLSNATVVLFKHPYNAWLSYQKRNPSLSYFIHEYTYAYQRFLYDYVNKGPLIFLQWERFVDTPEEYLKILCNKLEIPFDQNALNYWQKKHHYIGGNYNVYDKEESDLILQKITYNSSRHNEFMNAITNVSVVDTYKKMTIRGELTK